MPLTRYSSQKQNPIISLFWGKAEVEHANATYHFAQGNRIQKLLHQLKYQGNQELGVLMGQLMAKDLKKSDLYADIDLIIPVPLHRSKKIKRGYNQCDSIAKGIGQVMKIEVCTDALVRVRSNSTQTSKGFYERHLNVHSLFTLQKPELLHNKRVLLIDDVITTGSTLSSCIAEIHQKASAQVYVCTFAASLR